jgi:hypothetical protein
MDQVTMYEELDGINLAHEENKWRALTGMIMNLRVP